MTLLCIFWQQAFKSLLMITNTISPPTTATTPLSTGTKCLWFVRKIGTSHTRAEDVFLWAKKFCLIVQGFIQNKEKQMMELHLSRRALE